MAPEHLDTPHTHSVADEIETPSLGGSLRPEPSPALGHVVARGMTWMVAATVLTKAVSLIAQIVLGWKLSKGDFALFSTATAIAGFTTVCRDMGMRELLTQRGRAGYQELAGAGFWLALSYNTFVAVLISLLARPISIYFFGTTELPKLLWVMAMALPLGTPYGILRVKLRIDMRFQAYTGVTTAAGMVRQLSMIVLAFMGLGAMSMAIPVAVSAVVEGALLCWVTREAPWMRAPEVRRWPMLMRQSLWPMLSSVAVISLDWGQFLILGWAMGAGDEVLGVYSFAYNIAAQVGLLLSFNGIQVLVPALVMMHDQPQRLVQASLRALRLLMLGGSLACVGLAAVMDPMEHLFWRGRWAGATPAVIVLGVFFCWRITSALTSAILLAQGRFKRYALLSLFEGLGISVASWLAARGWDDLASLRTGEKTAHTASALDIALWTGAWVFVSRLGVTLHTFLTNGARLRDVLGAMLPAWIIALSAGAAGIFGERVSAIGPYLASQLQGHASPAIAGAVVDCARTAVAGGVCVAVFLVATRLLLAHQLRDALIAVPARFRAQCESMLFLGANAGPSAG